MSDADVSHERGGIMVEQADLMRDATVAQALRWIDAHTDQIVGEAIRICEIPAPTFEEAERAAYVRDRFVQLGLSDVTIDAAGNVRGRRPGAGGGSGLAIGAHLDTVFPKGTDVKVRRQGGRLAAPGIGDNSVAIASLLGMVGALNAGGVRTAGDLYLTCNTGEEGLGDLKGMKAFVADVKDRVTALVALEGMKINRIIHIAVGSRRYKVTFTARGGHSWGHFPSPSAIHIMGRAIAEISRLEVPTDPKTTYNIGVVRGGTTVNTIASEAEMLVDMRSVDIGSLADLERRVLAVIARTAREGDGQAKLELVGDRPAGRTAESAPIVQTALAVSKALGLPAGFGEGSTDSNIPMSLGIPAITVGGGGSATGGHSLSEAFDSTDSWKGTQRVLALAVALAR